MTKDFRKPKTVLVPFGYPGYPMEYLKRFTNESIGTFSDLGIEVVTTPIVIDRKDIVKARSVIEREEADFITPLLLSWLEAPDLVETLRESLHKPVLLWSHTMFEEDGELVFIGPMPAAGVIRQTLEEMGVTFKFIYGMPGEEKVKKGIRLFSKAAFARRELAHSRIGLLGYPSMGMYTACFDHLPLREKLGPEVDQLDQYALIQRIEKMEKERAKDLIGTAKKSWEIGDGVTDKDLETTLKMYLALKEIAQEHDWSALTIKCQYELSQYYKAVPCVALSMFGDELPCSCEGDVPLIVTQLMVYYLTRNTVSYGDIHTVTDKGLLFGACGYAPFGLGEGKPKVGKSSTDLFEGLMNCTVYAEGKITLARLAYTRERDFKMHIACGQAKRPPTYHEIGCLPFPCMEVILEGDPDSFAQRMMSQHYGVVYTDAKRELLQLCELLGIHPVLCE